MKERNLQAIVATVVSNSSIIDAMKHLSTSEQQKLNNFRVV